MWGSYSSCRHSMLSVLAIGLMLACDSSAPTGTHAEVLEIVERSCGARASRCHGGTRGGAFRLVEGDLRRGLVGVQSCSYSILPLVDPSNPEGSWLIAKLEGDHDAEGRLLFAPDPDWSPDRGADCPSPRMGADFGYLMPERVGAPQRLAARDRLAFRAWIEAGAPGP